MGLNFTGEPNRVYKIGVQAEIHGCVGIISWSNKTCITEAKAPDNVSEPTLSSDKINEEGQIEVELTVPDQSNGLISCMYVIVRPESGSIDEGVETNYTLDDLIKANNSFSRNTNGEYIAVSLDSSSASNTSCEISLGNGEVTPCDASQANQNNKNTSIQQMLLVGNNKKLNQNTNYSIFVVTTTPTSSDILLQSSDTTVIIGEHKDSVESSLIGAIAGGVAGFLMIVLIVTGTVWRRRSRTKKPGITDERAYNTITIGNIQANREECSSDVIDTDEDQYEPTYMNVACQDDVTTTINIRSLEEVYKRMQQDNGYLFDIQFQEIVNYSANQKYPTTFASSQHLTMKNRYKNILPFDATRVSINNGTDGFINACFIDGYERKRKFIATQGPMQSTLTDFWVMIVEQECQVIVMLARCSENGKRKCQQYWPELNQTIKYGEVQVTNVAESHLSGFVCRTLKVTTSMRVGIAELMVSQFHFLNWPDHGIPITTSPIIQMHKAITKDHERIRSSSPIVVHCSAGVGRTGTLIGFDILMNESRVTKSVDVYRCVGKMRSQRKQMVQTCDQYIFIHKLLLESYLFGDTEYDTDEFRDVAYKAEFMNRLLREFDNIKRVAPMDMQRKGLAKVSSYDQMKVRVSDAAASQLTPSYIQTYEESTVLMVSKQPQEHHERAFWQLVFEQQVGVIVMIYESKNGIYEYWNTLNQNGETSVYVESEDHRNNIVIRSLKLVTTGLRTISHISISLDERETLRSRTSKFIEGVSFLQSELRQQNGTALIHCIDGKTLSPTFCAVVNLLDRIKSENKVDVFRTVKDITDCKEGSFLSFEHYKFCYDVVLTYLQDFDMYSNFK